MRTFVLPTLLGINYDKSDDINEMAMPKGFDFISFKDTGFISASRHGLRLDPILMKPVDQTVIFFGSVI